MEWEGIGYEKRSSAVITSGDFNQVFVASSDPNVEQLLKRWLHTWI